MSDPKPVPVPESASNMAAQPPRAYMPSDIEILELYANSVLDLQWPSYPQKRQQTAPQVLNLKKIRTDALARAQKVYQKDYLEALVKAIVILLQRGNNISKVISKFKGMKRFELECIKRTFHIQDKPNHDIEAVTLSRLGFAFPELVAKVAIRLTINDIVRDAPDGFPVIMKNKFFAGLLPKTSYQGLTDDQISSIRRAFIVHEARRSVVLSGNKVKLDHKLLDRTARYVDLGSDQSPVALERQKKFVTAEYGILTSSGTLHDSIITMAAQYDSILNS